MSLNKDQVFIIDSLTREQVSEFLNEAIERHPQELHHIVEFAHTDDRLTDELCENVASIIKDVQNEFDREEDRLAEQYEEMCELLLEKFPSDDETPTFANDSQPTNFEDSGQATDFFADMMEMINDPRIDAWLEITDQNYHKRFAAKFAQLRVQLNDLVNDLDGCD